MGRLTRAGLFYFFLEPRWLYINGTIKPGSLVQFCLLFCIINLHSYYYSLAIFNIFLLAYVDDSKCWLSESCPIVIV